MSSSKMCVVACWHLTVVNDYNVGFRYCRGVKILTYEHSSIDLFLKCCSSEKLFSFYSICCKMKRFTATAKVKDLETSVRNKSYLPFSQYLQLMI